MVLSGNTIREYINRGLISVQPYFDENQLRPLGLRVHLGSEILIPESAQRIDLSSNEIEIPKFRKTSLQKNNLTICPGDFILASTVESIMLHPSLLCRLDGRSTLARMGLLVHCTSETIDGVYQSHQSIVLEIANVGPFEIIIPRLLAIGMLVFETLSLPVDISHEQDQYKDQTSTLPPNLGFEIPSYKEKKRGFSLL